MKEQLALLPGFLAAHLELALTALLLGAGISIPLGIAVTRRRRLEPAVLGIAGVIQTIPSLALLAIMVPVLAVLAGALEPWLGISLRSIGFLPAVLALTLYSTLPILRNTVTGIAEVDPAVIEAARATGMTERQRLLRVELPLALPTVVAGLRTAAVWVVGTATLSTPVGATSLGNFIFTGLQTRNLHAVLVGCVSAALLALVLDQLIAGIERSVGRDRRRLLAAPALVAVLVTSFVASQWLAADGRERVIRIGTKTFTEQYILGALLEGWVEGRTSADAELVPSLGSTVAFDALRNDQIDLYVDYSGTIWATVMKRPDPLPRDQLLEAVRRYLAREHGVVLVARLGFENTYALGMRRDHASRLGVRTLSELSAHSASLEIGGDIEFFARNEWKSLLRTYGFAFARERSMDAGLMYQALVAREVDVISAFSTDGRIAAYDIALIEDDRGVIPPYDAILLASPRLARESPEIVEALAELDGRLGAAEMRRANLAVDREGRAPADVAAAWSARLARGP